MNVFRLDDDPAEAARALCDAHLTSQVKEVAQILSTALWLRLLPRGPGVAAYALQEWGLYRPTHAGHPCTRAAAADLPDFVPWALAHARAIDAERAYRRPGAAPHASLEVAVRAAQALRDAPPAGEAGAWPQAFGDYAHLRAPSPVAGYRAYYAAAKLVSPEGWHAQRRPLGRWTRRPPPAWLSAQVREVRPGVFEAHPVAQGTAAA